LGLGHLLASHPPDPRWAALPGAVRLRAGAGGHARAGDPAPHRPAPGPSAAVPATYLSPLAALPSQALDGDAAVRPALLRQVTPAARLAAPPPAPGGGARAERRGAARRLALLRRPGTPG